MVPLGWIPLAVTGCVVWGARLIRKIKKNRREKKDAKVKVQVEE